MAAIRKTWIVVADGARASILNYQGPNEPLAQVEGGALEHINEPTRELVSDKQGRIFHSADGTRSTRDFPTDPHEFEKVRFAGEIVDFLAKHASGYERLILVSPPKMLGELRRQLPRTLMDRVDGEIDKELTNLPVDQLPRHLRDIINIRD